MLLIDTLARTVTDAEIPLGILTAIVGAPFFAYLLRKTKGSWGVTQ
jgi:iron complex transport system permease protein